jgi:hypothetical protein
VVPNSGWNSKQQELPFVFIPFYCTAESKSLLHASVAPPSILPTLFALHQWTVLLDIACQG